MQRRNFITLLGGAAAAWPVAARAQQVAMPVIGFLGAGAPDAYTGRLRAFHEGLSQNGLVEGRNVTIEYRWANDQYDRLPELAADLVRRQVTVIVAGGGPTPGAAKAATTTIPIVFTIGADPVQVGLVASLNRPGGNLTGVTNLAAELGPKRLELLHEVVPMAATMALLVNPTNRVDENGTRNLLAAARKLGLQLHILHASIERDFDTVFADLLRMHARGLVVAADPFFNNLGEQLGALALRHAVPAIYQRREFAASGGLMSYGDSSAEGMYRLVGSYAVRILKGEKPADLPVQQATRVELIINLKTAKALGLTFPLTLLGRADEVIE